MSDVSLKGSIIVRIIEFFKRPFFYFFKSWRITYFDLIDEYEDFVRGEDVSKRNTLLGAVKNAEQYEINLRHNFYHVPADAVDFPESVRYIALYRSKNFFSEKNPGVIHFGKVTSYEKLPRREIKELRLNFTPEALYYRFNVAEWQTLENPLIAKEIAPISCIMTSLYLLKNCRYVYELYFENNNEFKLYLGLNDIVSGVYDGFFVNESRVYVNFSRIILLTPKGKFSFKVKDYKRYTFETFTKIKEILLCSL